MPIILYVGFLALLAELCSGYRACVAHRVERISCLVSHGKQLPLPSVTIMKHVMRAGTGVSSQGSFSLHNVHRPGSSLTPVQKHSFCFRKHLCRSVFPLKAILIVLLRVGWEETWGPKQPAWTNGLSGPLSVPIQKARVRKKCQFRKASPFTAWYWCLWQSACPSFCFTSFKLTQFKLDPYIFHEKDRGDIMRAASIPCSIIKWPNGDKVLWSRNEVTLPARTMRWSFYTPALMSRVSH